MSDSLYVNDNGTPVPLNLGTGIEFVERIEALEGDVSDLNTFKTSQSTRDSQQDSAITSAQTTANSAASAASAAQTAASGANSRIDALAEVASTGSYNDLKDKPAVPVTPKAYITETWSSGANWYRKYSDGWIEQGGIHLWGGEKFNQTGVVTLNTPFATTQYTTIASGIEDAKIDTPTSSSTTVNTGRYTTTTFKFVTWGYASAHSSLGLSWKACGY